MAFPAPRVTFDGLINHRQDSDVVVLDCLFALADPTQGQRAYEQGHIPGAYHLDLNRDLSSPVQTHGGRHPLPDIETLAAKLGHCGIESQKSTPVVIYDDFRGAFAARCWWLLRYYGHESVAVLEGGISAWTQAGQPLSAEVPRSEERRVGKECRSRWSPYH